MKTSFKALCAGALLGIASLASQAAEVILVNTDPAGVGFNDPTPAAPVGGNKGTTVGDQRLIAYGRALNLWGSVLKSNVPITVLGSFSPLTCTATGGTLAQAGAWNIELNFPNAPKANTLYHSALANSIAGMDLYTGTDIVDGADVAAFFNGSLGSPGCLEGSTWYYGLDGNTPASKINFLNVFMHELSHGLGFSNFVSESTGARLAGFNDVYMTFTRDNVTGKLWSDMTAAEIKAAAVRDGQEVWVGPNVTARAPLVLGTAVVLPISAPASVYGAKDFLGGASFGATPTSAAFTGPVVAGLDLADAAGPSANDGCGPFTNAAAVAGKVAIVRRGTCGFVVKAKNAQLAGAKAVIIANNAVGAGPIGLGGSDPTVTIPAISVGTADGDALIAVGTSTSLGLLPYPGRLAGADSTGHVRIYAPTTVASGSSGSHWDVVAEPSLLLEPFDTPALKANQSVDLTIALFEDIGWKTELNFANCGTGTGIPGTTVKGEMYAYPVFACIDNTTSQAQLTACVRQVERAMDNAGLFNGSGPRNFSNCPMPLPF